MLQVSENYRQQIKASDRRFLLKAVFCQFIEGDQPDAEGEKPFREVAVATGADSLVSMTLEESAAADDRISMGSFCSAKLTMELIDAPSDLDYDHLAVKAYSGLLTGGDDGEAYEYVPLGVFYITEAVTRNNYKNLTLTAYDGACLLEEDCTVDEGYPISLEDLVRAIAEKKELVLHPQNQYKNYLLPSYKEGYTYRQMLGFAAGLVGCNVRFDRYGRLQFYWYQEIGEQALADRESQYLNEFIPSTVNPAVVTSLLCSDGDQVYARGAGTSGLVLSFENPYMTESIMEDIWQEKIALMDTAEEISAFQAIYDGTPDEMGSFTGLYNQSMEAFRCLDTSCLHHGTMLQMTHSLEDQAYMANLIVENVNEERNEFTFSWEEEEDADSHVLPDGISVQLTIRRQWMVTDGSLALIAEGDILKATAGDENLSQSFTACVVSMIDRTQGEIYLSTTAGLPIQGMAAGTALSLAKQKINDYRISYLPAELKWRGNPAVEAGDILPVEKADGSLAKLYTMAQTLKLSGGLQSQIISKGENETSANFSSAGDGPADKKLERVYTSLSESILRATKRITGQRGGHVVINENDNGPAEILIMDTDDIRTARKVWRWNQGGLGYSSSGYNGPYGTAITQDGEIVGAYLQAESIAGSKLKIDSQIIEKIVSGINQGEQKINSASLDIDSEDIAGAIKMQVSQSGGSNKISNSAGAYGLDGWIASGAVTTRSGEDERINLISDRAFSIPAEGILQTDIQVAELSLTAGISYTLSAVVKQNDAAGCIQVLSGTENCLTQINAGGSGDHWQKYTVSFVVTEKDMAGPCSIKITSVNGAFLVGDLLLCEGSQTMWSAYPGEVDSATLTMSQFGITIRQESAETKTVIDSAGTRVINIESEATDAAEDVVAQYTKNGVEAKTLIAREQVAVGRVRMIALDDRQMAAWVINNDSEVDL